MSKLGGLFHRSCRHEVYYLYISYIVNLVIINIFFMLATGVSNIKNEYLSENDMSQLMTIISSIVLVSVLTIIFFQWIISMQLRALYNRRNQFNVNIRLIGVNRTTLCKLYLKELLFMQIFTIPVGMVISEIVYKILASILDLSEKYISITYLVLASVFHLLVIIICETVTIVKLTKRGIAEQLRKTTSMESIPSKRKLIVYFIVGVIIMAVSYILQKGATMRQTVWMSKLIIFLSFFFFYDPIMYLFNKIVCFGALKLKTYDILLAQKINYGYFYRVKIVCLLFIFSTTIFAGLQMLYETVRDAGRYTVYDNIKYDGVITWDELQEPEEQEERDIFWGVRFKTKTETGTNIFIAGINEQYLDSYEQIRFVDENSEKLFELNRAVNNGIILPEFFITKDDIGKEMRVQIGDYEVTFRILGGYYSNDFSKLICYVDDTYIRQQLDLSEKYNIAYIKDQNIDLEDLRGKTGFYQSKEDISNESLNKAVGGTEIVEMITMIIIICSVISLVNFYAITASINNNDIIRFRAIGISSKEVTTVYIIHAVMPIVFSVVWIIPFSSFFCKIACNIMLASEYFNKGYAKKPALTAAIVILVAIISIIAELIFVWKAACSKTYTDKLKCNNFI